MDKETFKEWLNTNKEKVGMCAVIILLVVLIGFSAKMAVAYRVVVDENERINSELKDIKYQASKLELCPMCGDGVKLLGNDSFHIYCDSFNGDGCGLRTGYYDSKQQLIETWNSIPRDKD